VLQAAWPEVVGPRVASVAQPVAEGPDGAVIACTDPVWAEELSLMAQQLLERLRERLGDGAPKSLRFRVEEVDR
jgi:predicted nucleic acid-binding Zn ribbon protein